MTLTSEQKKRFEVLLKTKDAWFENLGQPNWETIESFIASELQLERERVIIAFKDSGSIFFREHDLKPCGCLFRYVKRRLES